MTQRPHIYRRRPRLSRGRASTIERLIERITAERGRPPSDEEIASLLAMNVERVRKHRDALGRRR